MEDHIPTAEHVERRPSGLLRKTGVAAAGGVVVTAGVVMLVTPGPGVLTIMAGLGILGSEFAVARRGLDGLKRLGRRSAGGRDDA